MEDGGRKTEEGGRRKIVLTHLAGFDMVADA